jgi:hypothetical protein
MTAEDICWTTGVTACLRSEVSQKHRRSRRIDAEQFGRVLRTVRLRLRFFDMLEVLTNALVSGILDGVAGPTKPGKMMLGGWERCVMNVLLSVALAFPLGCLALVCCLALLGIVMLAGALQGVCALKANVAQRRP